MSEHLLLPKLNFNTINNSTEILNATINCVRHMLTVQLPEKYVYHNLAHTEATVRAALQIGRGIGLPAMAMWALEIAAWFHDTGYIYGEYEHESVSCNIARNFLVPLSCSEEFITMIENCIKATKTPQNPQNLIEAVLADADLASLGTTHYTQTGNLLRKEWELCSTYVFTKKEWLAFTLTFLQKHSYHTEYAKKIFNAQKERNIRALKEELALLSTE